VATVHAGRFTADTDEGVVVFLIGMRINRLAKVWAWLPVAAAMPRMLKELYADPSLGMLGAQGYRSGRVFVVVQYWRSFDHLEAYARSNDHVHLPAWRAFNARARRSPDVGIFHETYVVPAGSVESFYGNMPVFGLAAATGHTPVASKGQTAGHRLDSRRDDRPAVEAY
jgi:hypothetical protein